MANAKISELLEVTTPSEDDLFVVVDQSENPPTTKKIQYGNVIPTSPSFVSSVIGSDQNTGDVNGVYTTLSFTDYASLMNGKMDRPTASRFRALRAGWYKLTSEMYVTGAANDDGCEFIVIKNSAPIALAGSLSKISRSRNDPDQGGFCSKTFFVQLLANDYIEIQAAPLDGEIMTIRDHSSCSFEFYKGI